MKKPTRHPTIAPAAPPRYVKIEKMEFRMGQERTPANGENVAEQYVVELRDFALFIPIAASTLAARARRGRLLAAGLIVLLRLVCLGFMDPGAIAQEVVGQNRWRMAMDPTVLTVEQEKAQAAKPGSGFKECANGCPVMIVIPAGKFIMGSLESESDRDASEGPPHEVTITKPFAVSKFEVTFASFRLLYGFLVLGHSRREILWLGVTAHPSAQWIARQLSEAYGWQQAPQCLQLLLALWPDVTRPTCTTVGPA
jgi:hypothetical protein